MNRLFIPLLLLPLILTSCKKDDSPTNPNPNPPGLQHEIPWPSLAKSPWPMGNHDPQGTGRSLIVTSMMGSQSWFYTGRRATSAVVLDPQGTIYYTTDDSTLRFALYALNPDGSLKWKTSIFTRGAGWLNSYSIPIVSSTGTIYAISLDGNLYAVNPDGTRLWMFQPDLPIITRGLNIGMDGCLYVVSRDGTLYAVNPDSTVRWRLTVPGGFFGTENGPPLVFSPDGHTLYVGAMHDGLYAVDIGGFVRWFRPDITNYFDVYSYRLVDAQDHVYAARGDTLVCLKPDGTVAWEFPEAIKSAALTMDRFGNLYTSVYVKTQSAFQLISLDYSGNLRWKYTLLPDYDRTLVCDDAGTVFEFHGDPDNTIYAVKSDGTLKWSLTLPYSLDVEAAPAISTGGTLYVPSGGPAYGYRFGVLSVK